MPIKTYRRDAKNLFNKLLVSTLFLFYSPSSQATAEPNQYLNNLIERATSQQLWLERGWRKILFIPDKPLGFNGDRSLITQKEFFLASDGRTSPEHELKATLKTFFDPLAPQPANKNMHSQCLYAARFHWLVQKLKIDSTKIKFEPCIETQKFIHALEYENVSLVFSNYFAGNPGSLFGHTFLRLHRSPDNSHSDSALLDDIANFAAAVPDTTSLLYPIKGLTGGYRGIFALMPYYEKIQEYSNSQSRDLWEYQLSLTKDQIRMLEYVLWEVGWTYIDYYYLDDNCSYVMLSVLEAANPNLYLTDKLWIYAVPADTIRVVSRVPNFIQKVTYRPSVLSRYISRYSLLNKNEDIRLQEILLIKENENTKIKKIFDGCNKYCQAHTIDAALEFIDYKEKLVGSKDPIEYGELRKNLLLIRANEGVVSELATVVPQSTPPHKGHDAGLVSLKGGSYTNGARAFADLQWRPALHDFEANDVGYSDGLGISFLDTLLRMDIKHYDIYLKNLHFLEITSLHYYVPNIQSLSWHFDSAYEKGFGFGDIGSHGRETVQVGLGWSFYFLDNHFLLYALANADMGYADQFGFHVGPTLTLGTMARLNSYIKIIGRSEISRRYSLTHSYKTLDSIKTSATLSFYLSQNFEGRVVYANNENVGEASLGIQYYF